MFLSNLKVVADSSGQPSVSSLPERRPVIAPSFTVYPPLPSPLPDRAETHAAQVSPRAGFYSASIVGVTATSGYDDECWGAARRTGS